MKIISKWAFVLGLIFLLLSGVLIFTNHQGFALRLIVFAFWIFVIASIQYLWEARLDK